MRLFGLVFLTGKTYDARIVRVKKMYENINENTSSELKRVRKQLNDLELEMWKRHGEPYCTGRPGNYNVFNEWHCKTCRTPWPCAEAQLVAASMSMTGDLTQAWGKLEVKKIKKDDDR